jgi:hypothetical protein
MGRGQFQEALKGASTASEENHTYMFAPVVVALCSFVSELEDNINVDLM